MFLFASCFSVTSLLTIVVALSFLSACASANTKFLRSIFGSWSEESVDELSDQDEWIYPGRVPALSQLPLKQSKKQLAEIVYHIDNNEDGFVTADELEQWIKIKRKEYDEASTRAEWNSYISKNILTWDEYKTSRYSYLNDVEMSERIQVLDMMLRDRRRWQTLERAGEGGLNQEQFAIFLNPENSLLMYDLLVVEEMETFDLDRNDKISMEEYLNNTYMAQNATEEPEWVEHEKKYFLDHLDEDSDGYMDADKVYDWIITGQNLANLETNYLIFKADTNGDNKLNVTEIVNCYDLFLKSFVTEFGTIQMHDLFLNLDFGDDAEDE